MFKMFIKNKNHIFSLNICFIPICIIASKQTFKMKYKNCQPISTQKYLLIIQKKYFHDQILKNCSLIFFKHYLSLLISVENKNEN